MTPNHLSLAEKRALSDNESDNGVVPATPLSAVSTLHQPCATVSPVYNNNNDNINTHSLLTPPTTPKPTWLCLKEATDEKGNLIDHGVLEPIDSNESKTRVWFEFSYISIGPNDNNLIRPDAILEHLCGILKLASSNCVILESNTHVMTITKEVKHEHRLRFIYNRYLPNVEVLKLFAARLKDTCESLRHLNLEIYNDILLAGLGYDGFVHLPLA